MRDYFHIEEDFHSKDRKIHRKERKLATAKDRSKYKKSDQDQLKKRVVIPKDQEHLKRGRILAISPEGMIVDAEHELTVCTLKGSLKQETNRVKNLLAIGDFVQFCPEEKTIFSIEERKSVLSRADNLSRNKEQLIAVNIDQVLITASVVQPPIKPFLIDRYIIAAKKGNMTPVIVVNKIDLLETDEDRAIYEEFFKTYKDLGVSIISVSAHTNEGIEDLKEIMKEKASCFSGQSGVGKSSLINAVTGSNLKIGEIVEKTWKGSHTTTASHLIPLECDGFCIDTPGIKSFGVWDLEREEIQCYFTEIAELAGTCKYPDCSHLKEPECAVKEAVESEAISPLRFASYCALMESLSTEHKHR